MCGRQRDHTTEAVADDNTAPLVEHGEEIIGVAGERRRTQTHTAGVAAPVVAHGVQVAQVAAATGERTIAVHRAVDEHDQRCARDDVLGDEEIGR